MKRHYEIDVVKGIAVALMVIFHVFYMMNHMGFSKPDSSKPFLHSLAQISHLTFITVAGLNLFTSYKRKKDDDKDYYGRKIKRAITLLGFGMLLTFATKHVFGKSQSVKFGILHFMCVAIMLALAIFKFDESYGDKKEKIKKSTTILLMVIILVFTLMNLPNVGKHPIANKLCKNNPLVCFMLGLYGKYNRHIGSLDHHSVFSKFPYFALGLIIGKNFFNKKNKKIVNLEKHKNNKIIKSLAWLGKNSLNVYLVHWVILYGIIYMVGGRAIKIN